MQGESIPTLRIPSEEMQLRNKLRGTVWEPGFTIPGILQGADVVKEVQAQFPSVEWDAARIDWDGVIRKVESVDVLTLQVYWMSATMRGYNPLELAPSWQDQKDKALHQAGIGSQRATSQSSRGLHPLIPPGLGLSLIHI